MVKKAIILAGGLGTRIKKIEPTVPKALIRVSQFPVLRYIVFELKRCGIEEFIFCLGHGSALLSDYIEEEFSVLKCKVIIEDKILGTGGAVSNAFDHLGHDTYLVVNGDTYLSYDVQGFSDFHFSQSSGFSLVSIKMDVSSRFGNLDFNKKKVIKFNEKGQRTSGWINAGHYLINSSLYSQFRLDCDFSGVNAFSIEKLMEQLAENGKLYGYKVDTPFIDIGVPQDLNFARNEFKWPQI